MSTLLESVPSGAGVTVIRLRSLGDCVLTTPALQLLHDARPDLHISVVVEPRFAPVFTGNPAVHEIVAKPSSRAELCLNLHGGTRSMWMTLRSGARLRAGFAHFPAQVLYNVRVPKAQEILGTQRTVHTAEHLASSMFYLGVPKTEIPRARLFLTQPAAAGHYAIVHPFASAPDKTWPADRFLALAAALARSMEPVFIGSPSDDMSAFGGYRVQQNSDLEDVKALLAGASLFVGNDSGPTHMAAAFGIPVIVLWGNSDRDIWSPWKAEHVLLSDQRGIQHIDVDHAMEAVERLRVNA